MTSPQQNERGPVPGAVAVRGVVYALFALVFFSGCAAVQVRIRPDSREERSRLASLPKQEPEGSAAGLLRAAGQRNLTEAARLARLLEAARIALPGAVVGKGDDRLIYNAAVRAVASLALSDPSTPQPAGHPGVVQKLVVEGASPLTIDPRTADLLVPADQVDFRGLEPDVTVDGFGLPYVAWYPQDSPVLAAEPGVPRSGMAIPVTAVLTFDDAGAVARLRWVRTLLTSTVPLGGKKVKLAADFTAPITVLVSHGKNRALDPWAMIKTDVYFRYAGLYQFQPYQPGKIPVVFVHGLLSRPEVWINALNGLLADEEIRKRYQFWFFWYPTGLPIWSSAALLRRELDRFDEVLAPRAAAVGKSASLREKILIGHSMGGIISNLLVREGGNRLWGQFSDRPFEDVRLPPRPMELLKGFINFEARTDVARVIFVSTPHRGSLLASRPISNFGASLIRLPFPELNENRGRVLEFLRADARANFSAPANSIRFLRPQSPLLLSILNLPRNEDIILHSIIGDRGRGDSPESSDGVVPYWSSHLPEASTETIVPSNHGANEHPVAIEEMRRILSNNP